MRWENGKVPLVKLLFLVVHNLFNSMLQYGSHLFLSSAYGYNNI